MVEFPKCWPFWQKRTVFRFFLASSVNIIPRPAGGGGGGVWTSPHSGFLRIAKIRRRAAPPGFHPPYPLSFPQLLWKCRPNAMWGQVTRSGQVTQLQNKFPIAPRLQCFRESYETFGIWWGNQCLQNVDLGFLISVTSGQVILRPPHYKSMGKKINSVIFTLAQAFLSGIISYRIVVNNSSKNLHCLPLERSFEVTRGHQPSFANNFWSKRDRDVGLVSVRSSWPGESTDMQYDPFWSSRDLGLTWPEVKLWPWPFKIILCMVRRAVTRQTRWYQIRCSTFKIKYFIVENRFGKFWNFDPWWPQFWPEPKNDRNDFEMIFRELSNADFRFSLQRPGAEIMGGGGVQTPPSRRWKIQRPSRARVKRFRTANHKTLLQSQIVSGCIFILIC